MSAPLCIECGETSRLVDGRTIYPHRPDLYDKWFYLCRCGAYCGCHRGTKDALGYPAGALTRRARSAAHAAFDQLWQTGTFRRGEAYGWLARKMKMTREECHIGMMTADEAKQVVALAQKLQATPTLITEGVEK